MRQLSLSVFLLLLMTVTGHAQDIVVDSTNDSGAGSLRQAVADAVAGDVIGFSGGLAGGTIQLSTPISIDFNLEIQGLGADQLTISGGETTQMLVIDNGANVTINDLAFVDGDTRGLGGAIALSGASTMLTINRSQFLNNFAFVSGGAIDNDGATLNIFDSTFSDNSTVGLGGAINNMGDGLVVIRNSTLSTNSSTGFDGGAFTNLNGTLDIANSAVVNNFADNFAGGIGNNSPSNIRNIRNTIVAGNTTSTGSGLEIGNLAGAAGIVSGGGNVIGIAQGAGAGDTIGVFDQQNDQFGTADSPLDVMLMDIADNGGPTLTHLPLDGSPVLDSGVDIDLPQTDQRGLQRVSNERVDSGPVEFQVTGSDTDFVINLGMAGSWFEPATNGQGWVFDVVDNATTQLLAAAWFTFDINPPGTPQDGFGDTQQRWFSAFGNFAGNTAELEIFSPSNGVFNNPDFLVNRGDRVGMMTVTFFNCTSGQIAFDFDSADVIDDTVQITRIASSELCQAIVDGRLSLAE